MNRALLVLLLAGCELGPAIYVERHGDGDGEVNSDPSGLHCRAGVEDCAMIVDDGTITLTATPSASSTLVGWSAEGCAGPTCTLDLAADTNVSVEFALVYHTLTVTRAGGGTGRVVGVHVDCGIECATPVVQGSSLELTAVPDPGSVFAGWRGVPCGASGVCSVTVKGALAVEAVFEPELDPSLVVAVAVLGNGRVVSNLPGIDCGTQCKHAFTHYGTVTLLPDEPVGWKFVGWEGPCTVTPLGCTLPTPTPGFQQVTATFMLDPACTQPNTCP